MPPASPGYGFPKPDLTANFYPIRCTGVASILHSESAAGRRFLRQPIDKPPEHAQTSFLLGTPGKNARTKRKKERLSIGL